MIHSDKTYRVLVAGTGQLGSRHLQGLVPSGAHLKILAFDPSPESLNTAKQRFEQVSGHERHEFETIDALDKSSEKQFDLVIISTNSFHRLATLKEIARRFTVGNIIFEKVLFPSPADYEEARDIVSANDINAWVNCPRRMYPVYKNIKSEIADNSNLNMEVVGNSWGLACNAIHQADLFAFFTEEPELDWDNSGLDTGWIDSKRAGYKEFLGTLKASNSKRNKHLSLTCYEGAPANLSIRISTPLKRWIINETAGSVLMQQPAENNWTETVEECKMPFQSALTHLAADQIFSDGKCELTGFEESCLLHTAFIASLLDHMKKYKLSELETCPIT